MKYRKLRIAWSVAWGLAAVLLLALWVRSYSKVDVLYGNICGAAGFKVQSVAGWLSLVHNPNSPWGIAIYSLGDWTASADTMRKFEAYMSSMGPRRPVGPILGSTPHWSLLLLTASLSGVPWLWRRFNRFGLRTLLIATTFVAVVLAAAVYAGKK